MRSSGFSFDRVYIKVWDSKNCKIIMGLISGVIIVFIFSCRLYYFYEKEKKKRYEFYEIEQLKSILAMILGLGIIVFSIIG